MRNATPHSGRPARPRAARALGRRGRPAPAGLHLLPSRLDLDTRVALALRTLCGLSTLEVARVLLVAEATMGKRLTRAKTKIARAGIPFRVPDADDLPGRTAAVCAVVHLVYTAGHTAASGDDLLRDDLCDEAIRLARLLVHLLPDQDDAGRPARAPAPDRREAPDPHRCRRGAVTLADQDRSRWDRSAITEGLSCSTARWPDRRPRRRLPAPSGHRRLPCHRPDLRGHRLGRDPPALRDPGRAPAQPGRPGQRRGGPSRGRRPGCGAGGPRRHRHRGQDPRLAHRPGRAAPPSRRSGRGGRRARRRRGRRAHRTRAPPPRTTSSRAPQRTLSCRGENTQHLPLTFRPMSSRAKVLIAAAVIVVALVGGGLWWFLKDDAPDEVSLEDAVSQVEDDAATSTTATDTSDAPAADGIDGTWTIDTESGEFDLESATGTFAGYRVEEELSTIGSNTAVGRTGDVTGSFTIEGSAVTEAEFEVDLTGLASDSGLRDGQAQNALGTSEFPTATFTLTEPLELGDGAASGDPVEVTATGDLDHPRRDPVGRAPDRGPAGRRHRRAGRLPRPDDVRLRHRRPDHADRCQHLRRGHLRVPVPADPVGGPPYPAGWPTRSSTPTGCTGSSGAAGHPRPRRTRLARLIRDDQGDLRRDWKGFDKADAGLVADGCLDEAGIVLIGVVVVVLVAYFVVIPLLFAVIDALVLVVLVAAAIVGRVLFRRPWRVEARAADDTVHTWEVVGWRASGDHVALVAQQSPDGLPLPAGETEPRPRGDRLGGDEALHEGQRGLGDLAPAAVDGRASGRGPAISTISVTPSLRFCFLYEALAMAHGTVWSFSPEMISSGPRSGFLVLTLTSVHGLRLAVAAWNSGTPGAGHGVGVVELLGLVLADRVGEGVAELLVGQRHGPAAVGRVAEHRRRRLAAPRSAAAGRRGTAPGRWRPRPPSSPRPARIWVSSPPNECPMIAGLAVELADDLLRSGRRSRRPTCGRRPRGARFASSTVFGSSGQPGASVV